MGDASVLMLGPSLNAPGGMTAVVQTYRDAGFFDRRGVTYIATYKGPGIRQIWVFAGALWQLVARLGGGKVTLLHVHSASRGSFWRKSIVCAVGRFFRVPYIFHVHSGEFVQFYSMGCGDLAKSWLRKTLRDAVVVVALTEQWRKAFEQIEPAARVEVITNPVSVPLRLPAKPHGPRTVLFLGRLTAKKGAFDLVQSIPGVLEHDADVRFILAGDGEIQAIRALAEQLGIADRVLTPGWIEGAAKDEALAQSFLLVLPSYFEGLPMCVLEAMACGVPVIATRVGGIPDVIDHGRTGLLIAPGDVPGLTEATLDLLRCSELRERIRIGAFDVVAKKFSSAQVLGALSTIYDRFCAAGVDQ